MSIGRRWRPRARHDAQRREARRVLAALLAASPVGAAGDPMLVARLSDPDQDATLDELGLDSLALLSLAVELELRLGLAVTAEDLTDAGSLDGIAALLTGDR